MKNGGGIMSLKPKFSQADWDKLSEITKEDVELALSKGLDSIGIFVQNPTEKSVSGLVQVGQSVSNPTTIGRIQTSQNWIKTATNGKVNATIMPYSSDGYSSLAVNLVQNDETKIDVPLKRNLTEQNCSFPKSSSRYAKIVEKIEKTFGVKIVETFANSSSYQLKSGLLKKEISLNCNNVVISDFDRFAMIFNCIAKLVVDEKLKSFDDASYLSLNSNDKQNFKSSAEKLVTLGLSRATILEDTPSSASLKLDDALKFEFFQTLSLLAGKRNDVAKSISNLSEIAISEICEKLGYNKDSIASNLITLGFSYQESPKTVFEAIFNAANLQELAIEVKDEKAEKTSEVAKEKVKLSFAMTPLLQRNILALEGKLKAAIVKKESLDGFFEDSSENIVVFALNKKLEEAKKTEKSQKKFETAAEKSSEIAQEFSTRLNSMLKKTYKYAEEKANKGELETRSPQKLFREANNNEGENKSALAIAKNTFKETVNDVVKETRKQEKNARKAKKSSEDLTNVF